MMSQASIIAAMPAIYYPKLLIISMFFPILLVTICYWLFKSISPNKYFDRIFTIVPSGILAYFIYIFFDKLVYSKYAKSSLDLPQQYKLPFLFGLFLFFLAIYFFHVKKERTSLKNWKNSIYKYSVAFIFVISTGMLGYYLLFQKSYDLKVEKTKNYNPVNILIVSIDGAEDDLMSVYSYEKDTTPFLKTIKNEFLIADNFYTNNCCTFGSIASMYTGKLPLETKVTYPGSHLMGKDRYEHLPGILKKLGYHTIQMTVPIYAEAMYMGILNGFDEENYHRHIYFNQIQAILLAGFFYERVSFWGQIYDQDMKPRLKFFIKNNDYINPYKLVTFNSTIRRLKYFLNQAAYALVQIDKEQKIDDDLFSDNNRTKYIIQLLEEYDKKQPFFIHFHLMATHNMNPEVYEKGLKQADDNLKKIYTELKNLNLLNNTLLVVTSDHAWGWQTEKPIPLLIRFPKSENQRIHFIINTQIIDLAPTILSYIGIKKPDFMKGESILDGRIEEDRPIYSVAGINTSNELLKPSISAVNLIKIQMCNKYSLNSIDFQGISKQTPTQKGYAIISPCSKKPF